MPGSTQGRSVMFLRVNNKYEDSLVPFIKLRKPNKFLLRFKDEFKRYRSLAAPGTIAHCLKHHNDYNDAEARNPK